MKGVWHTAVDKFNSNHWYNMFLIFTIIAFVFFTFKQRDKYLVLFLFWFTGNQGIVDKRINIQFTLMYTVNASQNGFQNQITFLFWWSESKPHYRLIAIKSVITAVSISFCLLTIWFRIIYLSEIVYKSGWMACNEEYWYIICY